MEDTLRERLGAVRFGLVLGLLAILCGWSLGVVFGVGEDAIREGFLADAEASRALYLEKAKGDSEAATAAIRRMDETAWRYFLRAHLHAGGIGSIAIAGSLLLAFLPSGPRGVASTLLGIGALGYPLFWMLAGWKAPGLASTAVAKGSLSWLAIPSTACLVVGGLLTLYLVATHLFLAHRRQSP
jgi:hypothetical protein